ncbi:hypothetical protein SDC9_157038 [bioreactor metagenome]|uniref:Uncharacterized protein n=1 Tax=bioreactor metagenome TaxID=1076179 RepID=A0A645F7Y3_9ZZZZ
MPDIIFSLTDFRHIEECICRIYCKIENIGAVTTINRSKVFCINSGGAVCGTMPDIVFTLTHAVIFIKSVHRIDRQV